MAEPLLAPKFLKVYMLLKQSPNFYLYPTGTASPGGGATGFYFTREEAEKYRTMELLVASATDSKDKFHIFELDIPNPAYESK